MAAVAPRYGITPERVREICEEYAQPGPDDHLAGEGAGELLLVQRIVVGLIQQISQQGADREMLLLAAQDAFEARRRLSLAEQPSDLWE